jgi:hypothetical protein
MAVQPPVLPGLHHLGDGCVRNRHRASSRRTLQYPIYETKTAWDRNEYRLKNLADHHRHMLWTMQPFNSDVDANFLGAINNLARIDRHRRLTEGTAYLAQLEPVVQMPEGSSSASSERASARRRSFIVEKSAASAPASSRRQEEIGIALRVGFGVGGRATVDHVSDAGHRMHVSRYATSPMTFAHSFSVMLRPASWHARSRQS